MIFRLLKRINYKKMKQVDKAERTNLFLLPHAQVTKPVCT